MQPTGPGNKAIIPYCVPFAVADSSWAGWVPSWNVEDSGPAPCPRIHPAVIAPPARPTRGGAPARLSLDRDASRRDRRDLYCPTVTKARRKLWPLLIKAPCERAFRSATGTLTKRVDISLHRRTTQTGSSLARGRRDFHEERLSSKPYPLTCRNIFFFLISFHKKKTKLFKSPFLNRGVNNVGV